MFDITFRISTWYT